MDADSGNPEELIAFYKENKSIENLEEMLSADSSPKVRKMVLEAIMELDPDKAMEQARRILDEDVDSDMIDFTSEILGLKPPTQKSLHENWDTATIALWEYVEKELKRLDIKVADIVAKREDKKLCEGEEKKLEKDVIRLLVRIHLGAKPSGTTAYETLCSALCSKTMNEKIKLEILDYFPMMVKNSTKVQKDVLFATAYAMVESGDKFNASRKLVRITVHALGKMLDEIRKIQEQMGGIPEKDKIFKKPKKHPEPASKLKTEKFPMKGSNGG